MEELALTKHAIKKCRSVFIEKGWIDVVAKRVNGSGTNYYKVEPKFYIDFEEYLSRSIEKEEKIPPVESDQWPEKHELNSASAVVENDQSKPNHRSNPTRAQAGFDLSLQRLSKTTENQRISKTENARAAPLGRIEDFKNRIRLLSSKTQNTLLQIFSSGGDLPPDCAYNISVIWRKLYPMEFQGTS